MTANALTASDPHTDPETLRRAKAMGEWRRQSRRVRLLRRGLPLAMATLVLSLAVWIGVRAVLTAINEAKGAEGAIHMTRAQFRGRNDSGRPFSLFAAEAVRDPLATAKITLVSPVLEIAADAQHSGRKVRSEHGIYLEDRKLLYMSGHVLLEDDQGGRFQSEKAEIDLNQNTAKGDTRVTGDGPDGHIEANAYSVDQKGEHVIFDGNVRGRFVTQKEEGQ